MAVFLLCNSTHDGTYYKLNLQACMASLMFVLQVVHEGPLVGMKHNKDDIEVAKKETECGVSFSVDPGFQEGDRIQCFTRRKVPQKLHWELGF